MQNSYLAFLSVCLLSFLGGVSAAQEYEDFKSFSDDFGVETPAASSSTEDLDNLLSLPKSVDLSERSETAERPLLGAAPTGNMFGGFVQFLFLVVLAVSVLIGLLIYRNQQAARRAEYWD